MNINKFKGLMIFGVVLALMFTPLVSANQTNTTNSSDPINESFVNDNLFQVEQNNINTSIIIFMIVLFIVLSFVNGFKLIASIGTLSTGLLVLFSGYPLLFGLMISIVGVMLIFRE